MGDKARVKEAFCLFDRDGDGLMSIRDFPMALRSLGCNASEKEMDDMVKDKAEMTYEQFVKLVADKVKPKDQMVKQLTESFKTFDRENNGTISSSELKHVLSNLGEKLQGPEIEELLQAADPTNSGSILYAQFAQTLVG